MADSRRTKLDSYEAERLSNRLTTIERYLIDSDDDPARAALAETARLRVQLRRGRNSFRRLGNGLFALSGFILVAFLAAIFDNKLSLLVGFIVVTASFFLGLVGYLMHIQADGMDLGDSDD